MDIQNNMELGKRMYLERKLSKLLLENDPSALPLAMTIGFIKSSYFNMYEDITTYEVDVYGDTFITYGEKETLNYLREAFPYDSKTYVFIRDPNRRTIKYVLIHDGDKHLDIYYGCTHESMEIKGSLHDAIYSLISRGTIDRSIVEIA